MRRILRFADLNREILRTQDRSKPPDGTEHIEEGEVDSRSRDCDGTATVLIGKYRNSPALYSTYAFIKIMI